MSQLARISWFLFFAQVKLCLILDLVTADTKDFYCSEGNAHVKIQGENKGRIITLNRGESVYRNNMKCTWIIETEPNNRIQFQVESSQLQWSPSDSICTGYDHVDIKEGSSLLASWCGDRFPKVINSVGNHAKIVFTTDEINPPAYSYRGARIHFEIFNESSCPPSWHMNGDFCYSKGHKKDDWSNSQSACNRGQANLLSITTQEEFAFVTQAFLNDSKNEFFWTGLNDVSRAGTFQWIDSTIPREVGRMAIPQPSKFYHCGAFRAADQRLMMKDCQRDKFSYLCKANRTDATILYPLPETKTNKGSDKSSSSSKILLGFLIPAVVLLVAIIVGVFIYRKSHGKCTGKRARDPEITKEETLQRVSFSNLRHEREQDAAQHCLDPSAPPAYEEALTHNVVS